MGVADVQLPASLQCHVVKYNDRLAEGIGRDRDVLKRDAPAEARAQGLDRRFLGREARGQKRDHVGRQSHQFRLIQYFRAEFRAKPRI